MISASLLHGFKFARLLGRNDFSLCQSFPFLQQNAECHNIQTLSAYEESQTTPLKKETSFLEKGHTYLNTDFPHEAC